MGMESFREYLPNLQEMQKLLKEMNEKDNSEILSKKYADAEILKNDINKIENKIKIEMNIKKEINKNIEIHSPSLIGCKEYHNRNTKIESKVNPHDMTIKTPINQKIMEISEIENKNIQK